MLAQINRNSQSKYARKHDHKKWQPQNDRHNDRFQREDQTHSQNDARLRDFARSNKGGSANDKPHQSAVIHPCPRVTQPSRAAQG